MPFVARVGDPTAHGGVVMPPGVQNVRIGGKPAVVAMSPHACGIPTHPPTPIVPGNRRVTIGGLPILRVGDTAGCGAAIVAGALNVTVG
jgi:uncharacterized Zn-binding protein involved in type VI secretion